LLLDGLDCITSFAQEESQSPTPIQIRARQSLLSKFRFVEESLPIFF
jgi:hypothetical protein